MVYQLWWHRASPFINGTELLDFILNYIILMVIGNRMESLKSVFSPQRLFATRDLLANQKLS